jgi:multidrug efflux system membrane fusion protein
MINRLKINSKLSNLKQRFMRHPYRYSFLLIVICWLIFHLVSANFTKSPPPKITPVESAIAKIQAMPILLESPGTVDAIRSVIITPQVTGTIKKILFAPGAYVKKGQVLFEIEPAPFLSSLQQMQAVLARDKAQLSQNELDVKRYSSLLKSEYVSKQQYEQAKTTATAQQAIVAADTAQLEQAQIQLNYTKIASPIDGKTGNVTARIGDLVTANATQPLVAINAIKPIWINLKISQDQLPTLLRYHHAGVITAKIFTEDDKIQLDTGRLVFIDNNVASQTGTVLVKIVSENNIGNLWPGQLVSAQLTLAVEPQALTIPVTALQIDQIGHFVYAIKNNKAIVQRVEVARQINDWVVISKGLVANTQVLTVVPPNFKENMPIQVNNPNEQSR